MKTLRALLLMVAIVLPACADDESSRSPEGSAAGEEAVMVSGVAEMSSAIYAVAAAGPGKPLEDGVPGSDLGNGCGMVTWTGGVFTVDFGTGCTLPNGVEASGSVSATPSQAPPSVTIDFDMLAIGGTPLSGTVTYTVSPGYAHLVASLEKDGITYGADLTHTREEGMPHVLNGTVSVSGGPRDKSLTFNAMTRNAGDCLPSAGTIDVLVGELALVVEFTAETPSTGAVLVHQGNVTYTVILPISACDA